MTNPELYIYGIMGGPTQSATPAFGPGVGGSEVSFVRVDDLVALVSNAGADPVRRTRRNMLAYTAVLEKVVPQATILPLRFGTVAPSHEALVDCIAANQAAFRSALRGIDGRVELGVKASWKPGHVFTHIVDRDQSLRQLRDRLISRPNGETYYDRIELGRRVEAALAQLRVSEAASIMDELGPIAERQAELRPHNEDMIFNHAFLVNRSVEGVFDAAMERLAEKYADRFDFRYVGPVPPFNFVTLHAGWLTRPMPGITA